METRSNVTHHKNSKFGLSPAELFLATLFVWWTIAGQTVGAQPGGNQPQTRYTIAKLGALAPSFTELPNIRFAAVNKRSQLAGDGEPVQIDFVQAQIAFQFVGQVTNFAPSPTAPLGSSNQYGYLTIVQGIDGVFSGSPHNETTALLTFFNEATTTDVFTDGPLRIVDRNGTTTIYLNSAPASFANPDSFRSGIPVEVSTLHQQAINDTAAGTFTAVFANTISSTSSFNINSTLFTLGQAGQAFRAAITGHLNAAPPPTGYFAGYAVGVGEE